MADIQDTPPRPRKRAKKVARHVTRTFQTVTPDKPLEGFMNFIRTQGVVGIAIGLVLGTQIKAVVDSFIIAFINPLLGLVLPGDSDFVKKSFTITIGSKSAEFLYGAFFTVLLSFVVVAAVVYFIVMGFGLDKLDKEKEE